MISAWPPRPGASRGDRQGRDGQGRDGGCQPKPALAPAPAWHPHCSHPGVRRKGLSPYRVRTQHPSSNVPPTPGQMQASRAPGPASPCATEPTPYPGTPRAPPVLSPVPVTLCPLVLLLVPRAGGQEGCCRPLAGRGAGRGQAAARWGLSPFPGSAERECSCKGHEAAEPHSHSHSHPGGHPAPHGGPGPRAVGEVFGMDLQEEGVEDSAGPGAGEQLGQQLGAAGEFAVGAVEGAV